MRAALRWALAVTLCLGLGAQAAVPRVLLLGDSISMGYTPRVAAVLTNEARVFRPAGADGTPENCEGTTRGVRELERWLRLGSGHWDVIHFNFGLHDLKRVNPANGAGSNLATDPPQADRATYRRQLESIILRLKTTGATLVLATTTPVPSGGVKPHREEQDVEDYNRIAVELARLHGVRIDDLHEFALGRLPAIQQPVNVHFTDDGSRQLGDEVAGAVRLALRSRSNATGRQKSPPNVVFILADDLGWGDLGCYNASSKIPTPRLDRLASQGLRALDAHSPSAVCTPTRYGIMTGRYAWRTRLRQGVLWGYSRPLIEPGRMTVASLLQQNGYRTACIGKWHLGLGWNTRSPAPAGDGDLPPEVVDFAGPLRSGPHTLGFHESCVLPGSLDMEPYVLVANGSVERIPTNNVAGSASQRQGGGGFWRAGPVAPGFTHEGCLPDLTGRAVEFIRAQTSQRPFFLYLPLTAPHDPWVPTPEFRGRSGAGPRGDFVAQVDATVGRVLDALAAAGLEDNTLVIFTSDNGAHWLPAEVQRTGHAANAGWRGMKSDAWDGGHRVPFLVRWPGVVRSGRTSKALIGLNDLSATLAEAIGVRLPPGAAEDSESFYGVLTGRRGSARESLVLHSINGVFALREGPWKYIDGKGSGGWTAGQVPTPAQLYRMDRDPAESVNLFAEQPRRVHRMAADLEVIRGQDAK